MSCTEERYLAHCKKNNETPVRYVHYSTGHTVYGKMFEYGFDPQYRTVDYKLQTLDLENPHAVWKPSLLP
jgi:hypothetical protein